MSTVLTEKQLKVLQYRKQRFAAKTRQLQLLLSGGALPTEPLTCGARGDYSEEVTRALAEELTKDAELVWSGKMRKTQRNFFYGFFYCALRISGAQPDFLIMGCHASGILDDVIKMAREISYDRAWELHYEELYCSPAVGGFFGTCNSLYQGLTGTEISKTITPAQRKAVEEHMADEIAQQEALWEEMTEIEDIAADYTPEELEELMQLGETEEDVWMQEEIQRWQEWLEAFPARDEFCAEYLRCRKAWAAAPISPANIADTVERAMDVYLYEKGASSFLTDDTFFAAYGLLDATVRDLKALLEEKDDE